MLDLAYEEDSRAQVDMNVVMTGSNRLVEVQATAEQTPFTNEQLSQMLELARRGVADLISRQKAMLQDLSLLK